MGDNKKQNHLGEAVTKKSFEPDSINCLPSFATWTVYSLAIIHQSDPLEGGQKNRVDAHRMKVPEYANHRISYKPKFAHKTLF